MTAKDLKNALLQEAVQGRLVPQIASEGNARDLLEEIRKSHTDLQIPTESAGKKKGDLRSKSQIRVIKKEKPLPEITEDEIPFDIPENWCWCRLGDIINIKSGDGLTSSQMKKGNIPVFGGNGITGYHNISNIHKESIVIGRVGFYCGSVHITPNEAWVTDNAFITTYPEKQIDKRFLVYVLRHLNLGQDNNATAQPVVSGKKIYPIPFPLPPLAEQKRIVAALEKFMPLIEEYGKKETQLKAINEKIGILTKKAILQEAVQGKLVPQIAAEGNARDLLEEIRKERLSHGLDFANAKSGKRKSKKETALAGSNPCDITEEEIPFDIPENWCWCRLGEICNLTSGQDLMPEHYNSQNKGIPYITGASNFSNGNIIINRWTEYARAIAEKNDLLLTCKGTVGEMAFLHEEKVHIARQVMGLRFEKRIDSKYMKYFITTQINDLKSKAKSMIPGIARDDVIKLPIPLPPLAEQKRIVKAIENLLPLCEALKI